MTAHFGALIRDLRVAKGMSQTDLAAATGILQPNISQIELGKRHPSGANLDALSLALEVDRDTLTVELQMSEVLGLPDGLQAELMRRLQDHLNQ